MKLCIGVLVAALTLVLVSTAGAVTLQTTTDTSRPWQQWANEAQVPTWDGQVPFTATNTDWFDCGGMQAEGCTDMSTLTDMETGAITVTSVAIQVYNDPDAWYAKATLYHELGQVFGLAYLTANDEAQFMQIVGLGSDASQWNNWDYGTVVRDGTTYHFPPFEWFAEGYRYCAEYGINQPPGVVDEEGLFYPGDQSGFAPQQHRVCQLIDSIGVREGIPTPTQENYTPTHLVGRVIKVRVATGRRPVRAVSTACCQGRAMTHWGYRQRSRYLHLTRRSRA